MGRLLEIWAIFAIFILVVECKSTLTTFKTRWNKPIWQTKQTYTYNVQAKTLAGIPELNNKWTGVYIKGTIKLYVDSPNQITAQLSEMYYADIHNEFSNLDADLKQYLQFKPANNLNKIFQFEMHGNYIKGIRLPVDTTIEEANLIKGLTSWLQTDLSEEHLIHSSETFYNTKSDQGVFTKMETDVTGKCETLYSITPVNVENLDDQDLANVKSDYEAGDPFIKVTKSKNYDKCSGHKTYHSGIPHVTNWDASQPNRDFLQLSTVYNTYLNKRNGTIYASESTTTVAVSPQLYENTNAHVVSQVKATLKNVQSDQPLTVQGVLNYAGSMNYDLKPHLPTKENKWWTRFARNTDDNQDNISGSSESVESEENSNINDEFMSESIIEPVSKDSVQQVQNLLEEIAKRLEMNGKDAAVLPKFIYLVKIIYPMNAEQYTAIGKYAQEKLNRGDTRALNVFKVYVDAITHTGTYQAVQQIKQMLESRVLNGLEAIGAIGNLAKNVRNPYEDFLSEFYQMSMLPEVRSQQELRASIILTTSDMFFKMHPKNRFTKNNYHYINKATRAKMFKLVHEMMIPNFAKELRLAVQENNSAKAQLYITAIGNLGQERTIDVYSPYLEGKYPTSTYIRSLMIRSMSRLAMLNPSLIRNILYNIYKDSTEEYEVRVTAVMTLMLADPSQEMLKELADDSNRDPSLHVRSAIQTAINYAAKLNSHTWNNLSLNARAAQPFLSSDNYGIQYSSLYTSDYVSANDRLGYFNTYRYIGSKNTLLPKQIEIRMSDLQGAWNVHDVVYASVSNASTVVEKIGIIMNELFGKTQLNEGIKYKNKRETEGPYSPLPVNKQQRLPFEGALHFEMLGHNIFYSFGEEDLNNIGASIIETLTNFENNYNLHITKIYSNKNAKIVFPLIMGMPFVYDYTEPILVHASGKLSSKSDLNLKLQRYKIGNVGFINTISKTSPSVGVVNKLYINVPIRVEIKDAALSFAPVDNKARTKLLYYRNMPYISKDANKFENHEEMPSKQSRNTNIEQSFGQKAIGMHFSIKGSYPSKYSNIGKWFEEQRRDNFATMDKHLNLEDIEMRLEYLGGESTTSSVDIDLFYKKYSYKLREIADVTSNSQSAQKVKRDIKDEQDFLRQVTEGMNAADVYAMRFGATFHGTKEIRYQTLLNHARDVYSPKTKTHLFYETNSYSEVPFKLYAVIENIKSDNVNEKLFSKYKINIKYDYSSQKETEINAEINMEASQDLINELKEFYKQDMYNRLTANGRKLEWYSKMANNIDIRISYSNVREHMKAMIEQIYSAALYNVYPYITSESRTDNNEEQVQIKVEFSKDRKRFNVTVDGAGRNIVLQGLEMPNTIQPFLAFDLKDTVNMYTNKQFRPQCTVEGPWVKTFANRLFYKKNKYPVVMMQTDTYDSKSASSSDSEPKLYIAMSSPSEAKQTLYIHYVSDNDEHYTINWNGNKATIAATDKNDAQKTTINEYPAEFWDRKYNYRVVKVYQPNQEDIVFDLEDGDIVIRSNSRSTTIESSRFRNATRGLCGANSGEYNDDFKSPDDYIIADESHFVAVYSARPTIDKESKILRDELNKAHYKKRWIEYPIVLAFKNNNQHENPNEKPDYSLWNFGDLSLLNRSVLNSTSYQVKTGDVCQIQAQKQFFYLENQICFTYRSLPACASGCTGGLYKEFPVAAICGASDDEQYVSIKEAIMRGEHVTIPQNHPASGMIVYRIPTKCMDSSAAEEEIENARSAKSKRAFFNREFSDTELQLLNTTVLNPVNYQDNKGLTCHPQAQKQFFNFQDQLCLTYRSVPACANRCYGGLFKEYPIPVTCRDSQDAEYNTLRDSLKNGEEIQLPHDDQATGMMIYRVPTSCSEMKPVNWEESFDQQDYTNIKTRRDIWGVCSVKHEIQVFENDDEICISPKTLPVCSPGCHGQMHKEFSINVSCRSSQDQEYRMYKEMIRGGNPVKMNLSVSNKMMVYGAPIECVN